MAATPFAGNAGFLIYVADASGYCGSVTLLLVRSFGHLTLPWSSFLGAVCYATSLLGLVATLWAMRRTAAVGDGVIDAIFGLFDRYGDQHYGEDATQRDHALQTADLARRADCSEAMIVAALLHDIGQLLDDAGSAADRRGIDAQHETTGAAHLARYFPQSVTEPVRLHVVAKRYLCAIDSAYPATLSRASALSLSLQGGAMTAVEARRFETMPFFADAVQLRRFDDMGKRPECEPSRGGFAAAPPLAVPRIAAVSGVQHRLRDLLQRRQRIRGQNNIRRRQILGQMRARPGPRDQQH
eukprot:gene31232-35628_t